MPRVQEYLPEQEAQGPVGQTSPMLDQVGMFGRGLETAGRDIEDAGTIIHDRQTQAETADAYSAVSEQRANFMDRIQQEKNDGTLDVGKIKEDYQKWTEDTYDSFSTTGGKDAFTRASARTGGAILQNASRSFAVVQGKKASDQLNTMTNTNSDIVMKDPSQYPDLLSQQTEAVQAQVDTGMLTQEQADQIHKSMNTELAKGAIRGYMQSDYNNIKASVVQSGGKVDPNSANLNTAVSMLNSDHFDSVLGTDLKKGLQNEIRANQSAAQTAGVQALQAKQNAVSAQGEQFKSQAYESIRTGKYDPAQSVQAFRSGLITAQEQLQLNHLSESQGEPESASNPQAFNSLMQRVLSPDNSPGHISDALGQLASMVRTKPEDLGPGSPYIGKGDFDKLQQAISMVPANRVNSYNEGQLLQKAQQQIGTSDPDSHYKLAQFTNDLAMAKQNALQKQEPIGPLLDPQSPQYFGAQIQKYIATPQQILARQADQARGAVAPPASVQTQPGVIPTPAKPGAWAKFSSDVSGAAGEMKDVLPDTTPAGQSGTDFASRYNSAGAPIARSAANIETMSAADIRKLNPKNLSTAQLAVASARLRQLAQGNK
jgi:hypothetical protein